MKSNIEYDIFTVYYLTVKSLKELCIVLQELFESKKYVKIDKPFIKND